MLKPFDQKIENIALVYAHAGLKTDRGNRIYAIAAKIISPDGNEKKFHSRVRYAYHSGRDRYCSGLSAKQVLDAPPPADAARKLRDFLKGQKVVFVFDEHEALSEIQALCGNPRIVDLGFAAEFFLPFLKSWTCKSLWEYLHGRKREKISFSASEAVEISTQLVKHICGTLLRTSHTAHAPVFRHYLKKSQTLFGQAFVHIHRHYQNYFGELFTPSGKKDSENWRPFLEKAGNVSRNGREKIPFRPVSAENLENIFRGLADAEKGFRFRTEQIDYAVHVAHAINDQAVLTIEAGTGTGKTRGYLIPVLEFLRLNPHAAFVISTYTKNLQEQIFQQELAAVREILPIYRDIRAALLKGKSAYLCAEKLGNLYEDTWKGENLLAWLYCLGLVFHFRSTDADAAGEKVRAYLNKAFFLDKILAEASAGSGCTPKHNACPAQVVTAEAWAANLVITNHHKLALIDNDAVLNGLFRNYVIDEANHFETAVRNAFGTEISSRSIRDILDFLKEHISAIAKRGSEEQYAEIKKAADAIDSLREDINRCREILSKIQPGAAPGSVQTLAADHPHLQKEGFFPLLDGMSEKMKQIRKCLDMIREENTARMFRLQHRTASRMISHLDQLGESAEDLKKIRTHMSEEKHITAAQIFQRNWNLLSQQVQMGETIRQKIHARKDCVVYTAATLCHRNRFDSFQRICGMDRPLETIENEVISKDFRFVQIPSPFAKDAMEILVPEGAVSGKYDNKEAWLKSIVMLVPELIRKNRGRTLVLFSSYQDLHLVAEKVAPAIADTRYPLLIQRPGQSTVNLCDEFRAVKESVLFGVDTFWYGVDFRGDTLTQVIITRIPYPPPSDPLQMARRKTLPTEVYWDRYQYDTDIKMRQGMGRLIRCDTDRGKVVILDARYRPELN
ncbi:MAG: ATP-dependent DNA helicase [Desulfobacterales bacterium]